MRRNRSYKSSFYHTVHIAIADYVWDVIHMAVVRNVLAKDRYCVMPYPTPEKEPTAIAVHSYLENFNFG